MEPSPVFEGGFSEPVTQAQSVFHSLMHALANPGQVMDLAHSTQPPTPISSEIGAIAVTLLDHDTTVWCDEAISNSEAAQAWLMFQTGTPIVSDTGKAQFALVTDVSKLPQLETFSQGSAEFPDCSTTIILQVYSFNHGQQLILSGPGIKDHIRISVDGLPDDFAHQWEVNAAQYPLGVDLVLVADDKVVAFPRTTKIKLTEN